MKKLIIILSIPLLFSCEKTIKYEIPELPPSFSVDARIMTGDRLQVFVGRTEYSLSAREPTVVSNALVRLIEDGQVLTNLQWISNGEGSGYYITPLRPRANRQYRIEVSNSELGMAFGEAKSLTPVEITKYEIDSTDFSISVSFRDAPDTADFYAIRVNLREQDNEYPVFLGTTDPSVDFFYDFQDDIFGDNIKSGYTAYLTDEAFQGGVKTVEFSEVYSYISPGEIPDAVILEVTRITEDYYLHERSKGGQYTGGDNPFAEPVQIHSNIENGFGIVAAGAPAREIIEF